MQVKVFKFDKNGRVSFTQAELEKLLNEIYTGGYNDGRNSREYWTWTSPYYTWTNTTRRTDWTVSTATPNIVWTSTNTKNGTEATMSTHDHTTDACINTAVNAATTFVSNM